jgi:hypothetical protein
VSGTSRQLTARFRFKNEGGTLQEQREVQDRKESRESGTPRESKESG